MTEQFDIVEKPKHYNSHPSGVECIDITQHLPFCEGNAFKYIFRRKDKGNELQDCKKALWYLNKAYDTFTNPYANNIELYDKVMAVVDCEESSLVKESLYCVYKSGVQDYTVDKIPWLGKGISCLEEYIEQLEQSKDVH